jgi:hypothetical protein
MITAAPEGVDPVDLPLEEQVEVVRMQSFSFDTRSLQVQSWPIAVGIDATTWASAVLVVAVHQINTWVSDTRLQITVDPIELDPDDPKQIFASFSVATIRLDSSTQAGTSRLENLAQPWGSKLRVTLSPLQGAVEAITEQRCTLSIWLVGRRRGILGVPHLLLRRANER